MDCRFPTLLRATRLADFGTAATIFTLPIIVLFFFAQKTFIQGISTTGGK